MADDTLTAEEVEQELEFAGLSRAQIMKILSWCQTYGYNAVELDRKLVNMGYEKVFTIYDEDDDEA